MRLFLLVIIVYSSISCTKETSEGRDQMGATRIVSVDREQYLVDSSTRSCDSHQEVWVLSRTSNHSKRYLTTTLPETYRRSGALFWACAYNDGQDQPIKCQALTLPTIELTSFSNVW